MQISTFWNKQRSWVRKRRFLKLVQSNAIREIIMIWGGISKFAKTELWINVNRETVNKEKYCEIIEE
jgi:hypothetical protein